MVAEKAEMNAEALVLTDANHGVVLLLTNPYLTELN